VKSWKKIVKELEFADLISLIERRELYNALNQYIEGGLPYIEGGLHIEDLINVWRAVDFQMDIHFRLSGDQYHFEAIVSKKEGEKQRVKCSLSIAKELLRHRDFQAAALTDKLLIVKEE
jgi:hypothetical protein